MLSIRSMNKRAAVKKAASPKLTPEQALQEAKNRAGGPSGLARLIGDGITPQAVSQWTKAPDRRVLVIEKVTEVSRYDLRPDIFGAAP